MQIKPSYEEVLACAKSGEYTTIPISTELFSDIKTPVEVLKTLLHVSDHCYMLESAGDNEAWGRYTFLGYDPKLELTCENGKVRCGGVTVETNHPNDVIRQILNEHKSPRLPGLPSFTGGLVGYFSYDYLKYAEPTLRLDAKDTEGFKDVDLMLFDKVIAFDHYRQKIVLMINIDLTRPETEYNRGLLELGHMVELIKNGRPRKNLSGKLGGEVTPLFQKDEYCAMVERAKHHIVEGDIFQIVLSNRLEAPFEGSLLNTYRILRTLNPSPYMFYFSGSDMEVAGASPETLVKLENGVLHTFPLAGTRPRGKTAAEDAELEQDLLADPKELAEHNMLVDLGRNDIGKISKFGTVQVEKYHEIQRYSHVMHIGSTVGRH